MAFIDISARFIANIALSVYYTVYMMLALL